MSLEWLTLALLGLAIVVMAGVAWRVAAGRRGLAAEIGATMRVVLESGTERLEREWRDELSRSATATRQELAQSVGVLQQTLLTQQGDIARTLNERTAEIRRMVEDKLTAIQADNEKKLEGIRATVDEKLHATLEQRLGESFRLVADRLDTVHRGLNDMRAIARDVGSLNRVLTNVKTRGSFGEWQLGALLEDVLAIDQYARNVETVPGSGARVEFAIRMPGRAEQVVTWLPVDAKFPREDYERLLDAQDRADAVAAATAAVAIERRLRLEARAIREKYLAPPHTTDYAILFVPSEGLYAEVLRRPGLFDSLHREHRVVVAGPTTLAAILSSLQAAHRSVALEKRSTEVWEVLGAVKTEFGRFAEILVKTKKKLDEASNSIEFAQVRTRAMTRQLKNVEALPEQRTQSLLPGTLEEEGDA